MTTGEPPEGDPTLALLIRHTEAENGHRLDDTLATLTADGTFQDVALDHSFHGHEGATTYYRMWWDAFDTVVTPERLYRDGTIAIAETTWRGTHVGDFCGIAATGRALEVPVIIIVELRDGLMASERLYWDRGRLQNQIGAPQGTPRYSSVRRRE